MMIKGYSNRCVTEVPWMSSEDIVPYSVPSYDNESLYGLNDVNITWLPALDNKQGLLVRWNAADVAWDVYFYSVQLEKF